jgi:hypothetical protein
MKEVSKQNFGLLIAYLLPGLVALWGVSYFSETVRMWLTNGEASSPTVAGFLYVTLAAFTAGLTLGAIRAVTVDWLHHRTGVEKPEWDFSEFQAKFWAFNQLVESQYCFYQFYAHMSLAVPTLFAAHFVAGGKASVGWPLAGCLSLELVLLIVSRATLKTYYTRTSDLLGTNSGAPARATGRSATRPCHRRGTRQPEAVPSAPHQQTAAGPINDRPGPTKGTRW